MAALDFPNSPTLNQVYQNYTWDGEKWLLSAVTPTGAVRYDVAQGLTANQQAQGRSNIGVLKKNYIINGAMQVSQEWGVTSLATNGFFPADMFQYSVGATAAAMAFGQVGPSQGAVLTPGGSPWRIRFTVTGVDATQDAADLAGIQTAIEGQRFLDLQSGKATAKTVTLQFGCKAPAGTYCVAFRNAALNRSYVAEFTVTAGQANTDTLQQIAIPLDVTGTWAIDNTVGLYITWAFIGGSTYRTTAGTWAAGNFTATTNQFNFMGTVNNVFELFDVSLTEGNVAPPFHVPDYASELAACRRYWQLNLAGTGSFASTTVPYINVPFNPPMRAMPTLTIKNATSALSDPAAGFFNINAVGSVVGSTVPSSMLLQVTATTAGTLAHTAILVPDAIALNARLL